MTTRHSPTPWRLDHERILDNNNDVVALIADRDGNVIDWPINGDDLSLVDVGIAAEIAIQEARGD